MHETTLGESAFMNTFEKANDSMKSKANKLLNSLKKLARSDETKENDDPEGLTQSMNDYYKTLLEVANAGDVIKLPVEFIYRLLGKLFPKSQTFSF